MIFPEVPLSLSALSNCIQHVPMVKHVPIVNTLFDVKQIRAALAHIADSSGNSFGSPLSITYINSDQQILALGAVPNPPRNRDVSVSLARTYIDFVIGCGNHLVSGSSLSGRTLWAGASVDNRLPRLSVGLEPVAL
jgi:hypothetical protein